MQNFQIFIGLLKNKIIKLSPPFSSKKFKYWEALGGIKGPSGLHSQVWQFALALAWFSSMFSLILQQARPISLYSRLREVLKKGKGEAARFLRCRLQHLIPCHLSYLLLVKANIKDGLDSRGGKWILLLGESSYKNWWPYLIYYEIYSKISNKNSYK